MDEHEALERFAEADRLYRGGSFAAALEILDRLEEHFPDKKNIMFPRARCMAKLDRTEEALALCNKIISTYNYPKAFLLKRRILEGPVESPETVMLDDSAFERPDLILAEITPHHEGRAQHGGDGLHTPLLILAVTMVVAVCAFFGYVLLFIGSVDVDSESTGLGVLFGFSVVSFLVGVFYIAVTWVLYTKADYPGWASLIPIYNTIVFLQISGRPGWWVILFFVPVVGVLIGFLVLSDFVVSYGKPRWHVLLASFLFVVYLPYLAMSNGVEYEG